MNTTRFESVTKRQLRRARIAVSGFFFPFGMFVGIWFPHAPLAKERLAASPIELDMALLCLGLGKVMMMPIVGVVLNKYGSARVTIAAGALSVGLFPLPFLATDIPSFGFTLILLGASFGALDVAANAHGLLV